MANADDIARLTGSWRLVSFEMVDEVTKERELPYGTHPRGFLILLPEGRMMAVITPDSRKPPTTEADRAVAFRSMLAYSGTYQVRGNSFITEVDAAWNEAWVGTYQERSFEISGDRLMIVSRPGPAVNFGNRMMHGELLWERETPN